MATDDTALARALDRLTKLHPKLIDLGLERTLALSEKCGNPHLCLPPVIHIAGTNGKGSVAAFLRGLYEAAGKVVHLYSSPHLCRFNERIRLAGQLISDAELVEILSEIEQRNAGAPITFFESTTIAAFMAFARHPADIVILETGLGGQFDSTNILPDTALSIITPVARDHEHFLGHDISGIAQQKAGIMRAGRPTIWARQTPEARDGLYKIAQQLGPHILEEGLDFQTEKKADGQFDFIWKNTAVQMPTPALRGDHQIQNAGLALAALKTLTPQLFTEQSFAGLAQTRWPGRIQELKTGHLKAQVNTHPLWLDGAHNAHGANALIDTLKGLNSNKWIGIFGALNTRPAEAFLAQLQPVITKLYCLTIPDEAAAIPAQALAQTANSLGIAAKAVPNLSAALADSGVSDSPADTPIIICGSLYLAGHVLTQNATLPD